jgi:KDO2-lipid IV(A) lauroyltransferase
MLVKLIFRLVIFSFSLLWLFPVNIRFWLLWQLSKVFSFLILLTPLRKTIAANLKKIYGMEDTEDLVKEYVYKMSRYIYEVLNLNKLTARGVPQILDTIELSRIEQAISKKRGVLVLVMHCGNWELVGQCLGKLSYSVHAVVNGTKDKSNFLEEFLDNNRLKNNVKLININKENLFRAAMKAFKDNELVMLAADTGATDSDKNIILDFLGHKLPVATGWATIALRAKPIILPVLSATSKKELKHQLIVFDEIYPENYQNEEQLLKKVLPVFEKFVKDNPTEWFLALSESEVKKSFGCLH